VDPGLVMAAPNSSDETRSRAAKRRSSVFNRGRDIEVVGGARHWLGDAYHWLLDLRWWASVAFIIGLLLVANLVFAVAYLATDSIESSGGTFLDAFFFSVQTMGTIGYGVMHPRGVAGNVLMTAESFVSVLVVALATGLTFAKFSRPSARILFSKVAVIHPMEGVPTLAFRVANERGNHVADAQMRVAIMRSETTREGHTMLRMHDLVLVRDRSPAFQRTWAVMHVIDEKSPLYGKTPHQLDADQTEIIVTLTGLDATTGQTIQARHAYLDDEIVWGARHVDVLSRTEKGKIRLDYSKFHDTKPTKPTETFPYPRESDS
jgi:inward rectifier potassium channel